MTARRKTRKKSEQLNRSGAPGRTTGYPEAIPSGRVVGLPDNSSSTSLAREPRQQGQLINAHVI